MTKRYGAAALLAATFLSFPTMASAQDMGAIAAELAAMRARIAELEGRIVELEAEKAAGGEIAPAAAAPAATAPAAAVPVWKGAPQFVDKDKGWSFKPRGRLQFDAGYVSSPDGIDDPGLGFATEIRRARLGVEGTMPGGFGYKFEADLADNGIELADAILSWDATDNLTVLIGHYNNFQSLEELTSSRFTSFMERAAFTDAFNFERRLGIGVTWGKGPWLAQAGLFSDNVGDLADAGDENDARSADVRLVYAPKLGETQLHVGGSAHWRDNGDLFDRFPTRYRQRPFVHTTDTRFISTPSLRVEEEQHYGLELAAIRGPFHAAAEAHWLTSELAAPGADPTFFGGYAEIGWFLTGESRGYKAGQFDRTRPLRPLGDGGYGALQLNLRYDRLDLDDAAVRGGRQAGYEAALIWTPQDHVRFLLNYAHLRYEGATPIPTGDRDYAVDVVGARAEIDF